MWIYIGSESVLIKSTLSSALRNHKVHCSVKAVWPPAGTGRTWRADRCSSEVRRRSASTTQQPHFSCPDLGHCKPNLPPHQYWNWIVIDYRRQDVCSSSNAKWWAFTMSIQSPACRHLKAPRINYANGINEAILPFSPFSGFFCRTPCLPRLGFFLWQPAVEHKEGRDGIVQTLVEEVVVVEERHQRRFVLSRHLDLTCRHFDIQARNLPEILWNFEMSMVQVDVPRTASTIWIIKWDSAVFENIYRTTRCIIMTTVDRNAHFMVIQRTGKRDDRW